jgi:ubiquinone/menaquinone biosynthesis C-methylase UbiE
MNRLIIFIVLLIITSILGYFYKSKEDEDIKEDFTDITNERKVVRKTPREIYDAFYSHVYDELFLNKTKNEFEIYNIEAYTIKEPKYKAVYKNEEIRFLDLGCGTGKHLEILLKKKYHCDGIDISPDMLEIAKKSISKQPLATNTKLIQGDFTQDDTLFSYRRYTHVLCLFFTIYYVKDVEKLMKNIYESLKQGGYMCLNLVNKKKFDPILEKSSKLIPLFNPQRHSKERVTKTKLVFKKFDYIADWKFEDNNMNVEFREQFVFKKPERKLIVNEHNFYMRNIPYYTMMAKKLGFELVKIIDLIPVSHDNSYIYLFRKR